MSAPVPATPDRGGAAFDSLGAPRRARLRRYGLWQLRDYYVDRGAPTVIVIGLFAWLTLVPLLSALSVQSVGPRLIAKYGSAVAARHAMVAEMSADFLGSFLGVIVFLGALFGMNGIVANDRKQGFYRFLFAKPVAPPAYYGQAFVLHGLGFVSLIVALALVYGVAVVPVLSASLLVAVAGTYLCYAGIAFALSAAARWDWLSLVTVTVTATYVWERFGRSPSAAARLAYLFPPIHRLSEVFGAAAHGAALPWQLLAWLAGYGAACFVIGLVVLRYRRLAIL